jgi:aconitate hydratase
MARESALGDFIASGARIQECACGFCVGNSQAPPSEGVSLRTSNRNFLGRCGTKSGQVYLCSPETAAASAITGVIADPREAGIPYPIVTLPDRFELYDDMFIKPGDNPEETPIYRGPHMGRLPPNGDLPESFSAKVTLKLGDGVTTDHIVPAGDKLKLRSNVTAYARYVFQVVDESFAERAAAVRDSGKYNVVIAGFSYGQGSSREHAALCPMVLGVRIIVAKTFERIHRNNLINVGILPLTFSDETDYDWIDQDDELELADIHDSLKKKRSISILDKSKNRIFEATFTLSGREVDMIIAGGKLPYMKNSRS